MEFLLTGLSGQGEGEKGLQKWGILCAVGIRSLLQS